MEKFLCLKECGVEVAVNTHGDKIALPRNQAVVLENVLGSQVRMLCEPLRFTCETLIPETREWIRCILEFQNGDFLPASTTYGRSEGFEHLEDLVGHLRVASNGRW